MEVKKRRSVIVTKFGGYDSLSVEDFALPELEEYVEVKVEYGGLNFADLYTRQGLMLDKKPPFVLGMECTGIITDIKSTKTDLTMGQKVICYDYKGGMYSEYVRISPNKCYPLPDFIGSELGATLFVNYLTAYFALFHQGNLKEEDRVLILSCAGGVGCAATQLARTVRNVTIYGTGSPEKQPQAKENGVDVFYSNDTLKAEELTEKFDVIVTNEAGPTFTFLQSKLNHLGRIVLIGANNIIENEKKLSIFTLLKAWWNMKYLQPESLVTNNRVVGGLHLGTLIENDYGTVRKALDHVFELFKKGSIKPKVHAVMPMSEIIEATKLLGERKNVGKVLIKIKDE